MPKPDPSQLSRRERQIMEIVCALGQATAAEILERLPDPPNYSTVRKMACAMYSIVTCSAWFLPATRQPNAMSMVPRSRAYAAIRLGRRESGLWVS